MAHTFRALYYHVVFSTKGRQKLIDDSIELRLHAYLGGIVRQLDGVALKIGGIEDHIHLLVSLRPKTAIADAVNKLKANSSRWVHEEWPERSTFAWQTGYGAFTVSTSHLPTVIRYIENQREHHRLVTFEHEYLALLARHGIEFDQRFVLD
jgi:REP element-mobilizing transposase RayT